MPKRTKSIFTPRKKYRLKFKQRVEPKQKARAQPPPGSLTYLAINQISGMLTNLNSLLHGTLATAPELLKDYVRRSAMELHAIQKLLIEKLPDKYNDSEDEVHRLVNSETEDAGTVESRLQAISSALDVVTGTVKSKAEEDLTSLGLLPALRELSIGKSQRAKNYISLIGGLKVACRELTSYWKKIRTQICENNRHDVEEYRELKSALHDDLDDAYAFIENLRNNV